MRRQLVLATSLLFGLGCGSQPRFYLLVRMTPLAVSSHIPNRNVNPKLTANKTFHGKTGDAFRMFSNADVTHAIPSRATTFVGTIAFNDFRLFQPESAGALARLFLQFLVDGTPVASVAMDHQTRLARL